MDANCRVGGQTSSGIGPHQADPEDFSGTCFRTLLSDLDCWLPSTFQHTAFGPGGTLYQRRSGTWDRSDFVGMPQGWRFLQCVAWVENTISAGHQCLDHLAVAVTSTVLPRAPFRRKARSARIDAHAISDPVNRHVVDAILASIPGVPWNVDASEHAALVVDKLYRGLAEAFPQARRPLRGGHFSDDTQRLHSLVCGLRHSIRTRDRALRATLLRCAFYAWKPGGPPFHDL